jgi:hypothetical protein
MNEYNEKFEVRNDVLHVHLSGVFPHELLQEYKNIFDPLIDACINYGCNKALVDARELKVDFDTLTLYQVAEDAAHLAQVDLRVALLAREDMIDPFFADVAYNRGALIGIFTDVSAATDWLHK